eukprot:sb/3474732/
MASDSSESDCPDHLKQYRAYKKKQQLKRSAKQKQSSTTPDPNPPTSLLDHPLLLKLVIWVCGLLFFAHHEFGSVYFLASIPVAVWFSMEEWKRGPGELSAYSVFNKNMERLDGQFTSEQWEKELRYGAASLQQS